MDSKYSQEELNSAVEAAFNLCEKIKTSEDKPFAGLDEIFYNSDSGRYLHYYPRELTLKLTSNCNLRCKHCFFYGKPANYSTKEDLPNEEFYKLICDLVEETYLIQCTITGGEIFSSPLIKDIIEFLKSKNIAINLISNATMITEEIADWLAQRLNPKYDHLQISLEGATPEINNKIRGKGSFEKTTKAIKYLTDRNIVVQVGFTVNSVNVHQIPDMYKLCKSLNVSRLNIGRFLLSEESQQYLVPEQDDIFIYLAELAKIYDGSTKLQIRCVRTPHYLEYESGIKLLNKKLEQSGELPESLHCAPHHELVALFPNGDISLCYGASRKDCILGNLTQNSFDEIWKTRLNSPLFGERKPEDSICKDCKYLNLCRCGCLYESYKKHGTINAMSFDCRYFKEVVEKQKCRK